MALWRLMHAFAVATIGLLLAFNQEAHAQDQWRVDQARKTITLKGYTRSATRMTLAAEVDGKVIGINYDIGQRVEKKPVIVIDATFVNFQIEQTRQSIRNLQVNLKRYRSRTAYLQKEFDRIDKLFQENSTAASKRDSAAEDLAQAKFEIEAMATQVANLEIQLNELLERKRRHRIYAPQGWVITNKSVEVGEIIQPGMPLIKAADFSSLIVPLSVDSEELNAINQLPKSFRAFLEGHPVAASLSWINPEFNEKTRKLDIELILIQYSGEMRGGLVFALPLVVATEGLRVPKAAVINRYENPRIKLKNTGEVVQLLVIEEDGEYLIIAEDGRLLPGMTLTR